jgi:hypothetical protein
VACHQLNINSIRHHEESGISIMIWRNNRKKTKAMKRKARNGNGGISENDNNLAA